MPHLHNSHWIVFNGLFVMLLTLSLGAHISAAEGSLGIVTGMPGKIMADDKVLAEVPPGTRLWIFRSQPNWAEVKVPSSEQHGWISSSSIQVVSLTEQQKAQLQQAHAYYDQYQKFSNEQKYAAATESLEKCLRILRAVHDADHLDLAETLHSLGLIVSAQGNFLAARKYYEEALAIKRKMLGNEHPSTPLTLNNLGNVAHEQGDFPAARKYTEEALAIRRKILGNEHTSTADTLNNLGVMVRDQGDNAAARKYYEEALAITRKVQGPLHPNVANTLNNLGLLARDQGEYTAAGKYFDEALLICKKSLGHEHPSTAEIQNNLGLLASDQDDYPTARKYYEESLAIKRKVLGTRHPSSAKTIHNLGNLFSDQGHYTPARKSYEEALAIYRKALGNDHPSTAETLTSLGLLVCELGDFPAARQYYNEALAIYRKTFGNDHSTTAQTLNKLGILASVEGNIPAGRKHFEEALAIYRKAQLNEHLDTADILNNLGLLVNQQGDYPAARKFYDEALAIKRKVLGNQHSSTADTLNNLGVLARHQSDYAAARKHYDEALAIKRKVLGNEHPSSIGILNNLGTLAISLQDYTTAREFYDQSRRLTHGHVSRTLPGLSDAEQLRFLEGMYASDWKRSLSLGWEQRQDPATLAIAASWLLNGKAVTQESLAARVLLARDATSPQLAPLVKELAAVRQRLAALSLSMPNAGETAEHTMTITQLANQEQQLARSLVQATGDSAAVRGWVETDTLRKSLPAEAVYVDLVRMELYDFKNEKSSLPHYLAWLIPGDPHVALQVIDLGEAAPIEMVVEQARAELANAADAQGPLRQEGEAAASAKAIQKLQTVSDLVLKPMLPHLADKKHLILSPDGSLWLLPWAALPAGENKSLLEQCSIRYVLSGRDLVKKATASKLAPGAPAIFVNPDYDLTGPAAKAAIQMLFPQTKFTETEARAITSRSSLPRVAALPYTALEGQAAAPLFKQLTNSEPRSYEQAKALEAIVKDLKRPKHLLLSTHGFFLADQERKETDDKHLLVSNDMRALPALTADSKPIENPLLRCGLFFAGCNAPRTPGLDDGILTGMEIVGMDLRGTELVVLSACETGIGKVRNGEGVAGLRQAFQLAGAQSVVSTLWQVPDRDSAIIMQDFFTNLAAGQSKAYALRNAQLKRIAARKEKSGAAHPFFWAAWTVTEN